jgi:hypothetical protein
MSKPFPEVTRSQQNTANSPSSNKTPANTLRSTANTIADFFVGDLNLEGLTKFVKSNRENLGVLVLVINPQMPMLLK